MIMQIIMGQWDGCRVTRLSSYCTGAGAGMMSEISRTQVTVGYPVC